MVALLMTLSDPNPQSQGHPTLQFKGEYLANGFTFLVLPYWCQLTRVVLDRIQEGRETVVCVCVCQSDQLVVTVFCCVDLKNFYFATGARNRATMFLFFDRQIVQESFVEDINNILSSGQVSNLYKPDEFEEVRCLLLDYRFLIFGFHAVD